MLYRLYGGVCLLSYKPEFLLTFSRDWAQHWEVCCDGDYKRIIERNKVILEMNRYDAMHLTLARRLISMSSQERA